MGRNFITQENFDELVRSRGPDAADAYLRQHGIEIEPDPVEFQVIKGDAMGGDNAMEDENDFAVATEDAADDTADEGASLAVGPKSDEYANWETRNAAFIKQAQKVRRKQFQDAKAYIEQNYRGPSLSEQLFAISQALLSPTSMPGFKGSLANLAPVFSDISKAQRTSAQDRAAALAKLQQQYQTGEIEAQGDVLKNELALMRARAAAGRPRTVGTQVVNGKVVAVREDPAGNITTTEIGAAPTTLKPIPGVTSGGQPVFMSESGPVTARGEPVSEFDVKGKPVSATEQREIYETEDVVNSALSTIGTLEDALTLNQQAYEGSLSGWRKTLGQLFSSDDPRYVATENFDNLMMGNALQSLKTTFGGNPTEGERKILTDLQAISSKPRAVREEIIRRAIQAAKTRVARETKRLKSLKAGEYGTRGGSTVGKTTQPRVINWGQ